MRKVFVMLGLPALLVLGCEKETLRQANVQEAPVVHAAASDGIPSYTMAGIAALLAEQQGEEAFLKKTELVAYILTRWLGEHAGAVGLSGAGTLSGVLPCDQGWMGDGGILRTLGDLSGLGENVVAAQMSACIASCIKGCTLPPSETQDLVHALLGSLVHQGTAYELRNHYISPPSGNQPRIFVSHGIGARSQGLRALGFEYNLVSGNLSYDEKTLADALNAGMLLLDIRAVGTERFNDPCWQGYWGTGNSGGGSGGGGGNDLDDDGAAKNIVNGPMVEPDSIHDLCPAGVKDGLRVVRFHLADRNEGGLFSGKSDVYLSASFWVDGDLFSIRTNTQGDHSAYVLSANTVCNLSFGKLLDNVPANDIGNNSVMIYPEQGRDWTIINNGFCRHGGYNRCKLTFYEYDPVGDVSAFKDLWHEDWDGADTCVAHFCPATYFNDVWFTNNSFSITPDDFLSNNDRLFLLEIPGGYQAWNFMPSGQYSWFEVELF